MPTVGLVGDTCGGTVLNSQGIRATINGSPVAVVGDSITPHGDGPHRSASMVSGSSKVTIAGKPICRNGDYASCGHTLSASATTEESSASTAPPAPSVMSGNAAPASPPVSGELVVTWGGTAGDIPGHTSYLIEWRRHDQAYTADNRHMFGYTNTARTFTITGLDDGETYYVRITAMRRFADATPAGPEFTGVPMAPPMPPGS